MLTQRKVSLNPGYRMLIQGKVSPNPGYGIPTQDKVSPNLEYGILTRSPISPNTEYQSKKSSKHVLKVQLKVPFTLELHIRSPPSLPDAQGGLDASKPEPELPGNSPKGGPQDQGRQRSETFETKDKTANYKHSTTRNVI